MQEIFQKGFLGNDSSFMLDFVVTALVLIVPVVLYSLYLVKFKKNFVAHKNLQITLGIVLLVAVAAFEVDMRLQGGWESIINKNVELPRKNATELASIQKVLWIHLVFAVTTPILWLITMVGALRNIPKPAQPCPYSSLHKKLGWLSTIDLVLTSITGLWFYYVAFVA